MPPRVEFDRKTLIATALGVVRREGWEQLSARTVAKAQRCSTRPVYTAFASMQELRDAVAERVIELLLERMSRPATRQAFVDMGLGYVAFGREEPALFRLFLLPGLVSSRLEKAHAARIDGCLMEAMRTTTEFGPLAPALRNRILLRLRVFTHGLACYASAGDPAFIDAKVVDGLVRQAGRAFYLDEVTHAAGAAPAKRGARLRAVQRKRGES